MSVIVMGMEIPRDCPSCPLSYWANHTAFLGCRAVPGKRYAMREEQYRKSDTPPDWCPLRPLPEKHGRLIEDSHLKDTLDYYIREAGWDAKTNRVLGWVKDDFIDSEPTIVESEGKVPIKITGKIYFVDGDVYIDLDEEDKP